jgi:hypothetical protein
VKTPADGWDADERDALDAIEPLVDELQARHADDPSIDLLRAARAGVLPEDVQHRVNQQLDNSWNRALVDGVSDDQPGLTEDDRSRLLRRIQLESARDARAPAGPWPQPRRRLWLWQPAFAMAAAVVIVAATAWLLRGREGGPVSPGPEAQVAVNTPPAAAPVALLPLDPPTIKISAGALTFRGARDNQLLADLKPAFDAIRVDDYRAAVQEFSRLAAQYPTSVEVAYYDGVARLFLDDPNGALASLTRAEQIGDSSFAPDIAWYQAVALERAGRRDEARARLRALCDQKGPRSTEACAAEPKLTQ